MKLNTIFNEKQNEVSTYLLKKEYWICSGAKVIQYTNCAELLHLNRNMSLTTY